MRKKRVLLVSEFSLLNTGFSVMAKDTLSYLHDTGRYEVAELASYVSDDDPRIGSLPWKVYPVIPSNKNEEETKQYHENYKESQFGANRFNKVVLDFQPDIVFSYRDFWHDEFITKSPYRDKFHYVWSACVDSEPQREDWVSTYSTVDTMTSYTRWGLNCLKRQGGETINLAKTDTMPGVDLDVFKPMDKSLARRTIGLMDDVRIFLTVMRNQPRKLYPEIIRGFSKAIDHMKNNGLSEEADKTFLYLHCNNNDVGFDLEKQILRYNVSHKVLFTYICHDCGHLVASFSKGKSCYCSRCGSIKCQTAGTSVGASREQLSLIYNSADAYIQASTAGALEIPIIEAKACGLPTMTSDYAAPFELAKIGSNKDYSTIKTVCFREEPKQETSQFRGYINDSCIKEGIIKFVKMSDEEIKTLSNHQREVAEKFHSSLGTAVKWESIFSEIENLDPKRWLGDLNMIKIDKEKLPLQLSDEEFLMYMTSVFLPKKHQFHSVWHQKEFLYKCKTTGNYEDGKFITDGKNHILGKILEIVNEYNHWESHRYNTLVNKTPSEDKSRELFEIL